MGFFFCLFFDSRASLATVIEHPNPRQTVLPGDSFDQTSVKVKVCIEAVCKKVCLNML